MSKAQPYPLILLLIAGVAGLGGLLFGYDIGVISGALLFIKPQFGLTDAGAGLVTGSVLIGAMIGALSAGAYADRFGRRNAIITSGIIFASSALVTAFVPVGSTWLLVATRAVMGLGVGGNSVAATMYIAEVSPRKRRGQMVALYQLSIVLGIFLSFLVDTGLSETGPNAWRWMFGLAFIPAMGLTLGMVFMPDSPRWLLEKGREAVARRVLTRVGVDEGSNVETEIGLIRKELENAEPARWIELARRPVRKASIIAVMVMLIQQFSGANGVTYYAPFIFKEAGFKSNTASLLATSGVGLTFVLATFIAIGMVDKLGRRKLLMTGLTGMALSLAVLGAAFQNMDHAAHTQAIAQASAAQPATHGSAAPGVAAHAARLHEHAATTEQTAPHAPSPPPAAGDRGLTPLGLVTIGCLVFFIVCYAFSIAPIGWLLISEVFPNRIRSRGVALGSGANWGANFVVAQTYLVMLAAIGASMTFWFYATINVISLILIWRFIPETKGHTLEEIEKRWLRGGEMLK